MWGKGIKIKKVGFGVSYVLYLLLGIVGIIIHVWTILIAYNMKGLIGACISFVLPILSEIFWMIASYTISHTIFTIYNVVIMSYAITAVILLLLISYFTKSKE